MNDIPLIKKIISTKKPLIISTGTSSIEEITQVLEEIGRSKFKNLSLLYCVIQTILQRSMTLIFIILRS